MQYFDACNVAIFVVSNYKPYQILIFKIYRMLRKTLFSNGDNFLILISQQAKPVKLRNAFPVVDFGNTFVLGYFNRFHLFSVLNILALKLESQVFNNAIKLPEDPF